MFLLCCVPVFCGLEQVATAIGAFLKKFGDDMLPLVESLLMTRYGPMLTVGEVKVDGRLRKLG